MKMSDFCRCGHNILQQSECAAFKEQEFVSDRMMRTVDMNPKKSTVLFDQRKNEAMDKQKMLGKILSIHTILSMYHHNRFIQKIIQFFGMWDPDDAFF